MNIWWKSDFSHPAIIMKKHARLADLVSRDGCEEYIKGLVCLPNTEVSTQITPYSATG